MISRLDDARNAYDQGDIDRAMAITRTHLRRNKEDGRGWELIGLIQYSRGRFAVSVSALERASLLVPLRPAAKVCLAHGYARIGRVELSRDLLVEQISDESLSIALLLQVATGLDSTDHPVLAMRACRKATERDPDHPQPYYDLGFYSARCGYPPHVTESLARRAIALDPKNVFYRVGLASFLMKQDRESEAYAIVRAFSVEQIERIGCQCCLRRIIGLFEDASDYRRVILCRQRLLELEIHCTENDCE